MEEALGSGKANVSVPASFVPEELVADRILQQVHLAETAQVCRERRVRRCTLGVITTSV
jgi:hypothetical protein